MAKKKNNNNEVPKEPQATPQTQAVVLIGKKPMKAYLLASLNLIQKGEKRLVLKARGRVISKAVDVAEIIKRTHPNFQVANISFGTEEIRKDNRTRNVSTMEIELVSQ